MNYPPIALPPSRGSSFLSAPANFTAFPGDVSFCLSPLLPFLSVVSVLFVPSVVRGPVFSSVPAPSRRRRYLFGAHALSRTFFFFLFFSFPAWLTQCLLFDSPRLGSTFLSSLCSTPVLFLTLHDPSFLAFLPLLPFP